MKINILEIARTELDDATLFYELEEPGLGRRFKREVRRAIQRIRAYPQSGPIERGDVRKCLVHTFPYKILYSIQEQEILVLAIAHQHRKPDYWIDRLGEE